MLHNTTLQPFATYDVNQGGRYIKVMSCESEFRLVAWRGAEKLLDTDVVAGAEITLNTEFGRLALLSETPQKVRLWVSQHKLNYDAMSVTANRSDSFIVEHYGGAQMLLPADSNQYRAKVYANETFFVGGAGVNQDSGIPVSAGTVYKHDSAAPLHAYIPIPPDYKLLPDTLHTIPAGTDDNRPNWTTGRWSRVGNGVFIRSSESFYCDVTTGQMTPLGIRENEDSRGAFDVPPILTNDGYWGIYSAGSTVKLREFVLDTLSFGREIIINQIPPNVRTRVLASVDDIFYMFCQTDSAEGESYVVTYSPLGAVNQIRVPALDNTYVENVQYDVVTNKFILVSERGVFTTSLDFSDVTQLTGEIFSPKQLRIFGDYLGVVNKNGWMLYKRNGEQLTLPAKTHSIHAGGKIITCLTDTGIYQSSDGGLTYQNLAPDFNAATGHSSECVQIGETFYFYNHSEIYIMSAGIDKSRAKARFRVFKESY